jgi:hypothetical protein
VPISQARRIPLHAQFSNYVVSIFSSSMRLLISLLLTAAFAHAAVAPEKIENVRGLLRDRKVNAAESAANGISSVL